METKVIETATDAAINLAHLTNEFSKAKVLIEDAIEDSRHKAERMVKQGVVGASDMIDDTTYYIKRHPWQAVGVAAALGAATGMLLGFAFTRTCAGKTAK